jgi:hypothetical protein
MKKLLEYAINAETIMTRPTLNGNVSKGNASYGIILWRTNLKKHGKIPRKEKPLQLKEKDGYLLS